MFTPGGERPVRRRSLFKAFAGGALAVAAPSVFTADSPDGPPTMDTIADALGRYPADPHSPFTWFKDMPRLEQLAVEGNPRLRKLGHSAVAFAVVHPGYIEAQIAEAAEYAKTYRNSGSMEDRGSLEVMVEIARGQLGDRKAHDRNLAALMRGLRRTASPVLCFVEERDLYDNNIPKPELRPPDSAFLLATQSSSGDLADTVFTRTDPPSGSNTILNQYPQRFDLMAEAMLDAGVTDVLCAGEYTFNPWRKTPACLGGVATRLMDAGFNVHGIEGAIFPPRPQPGIDMQSPLAQAMYVQSVPLQTALAVA